MSYLDDLANVPYKKSKDGQILFFPWGCLWAGYVVTSDAKLTQLRHFYKNLYLIGLPVLFGMVILQQFMALYVGFKGVALFILLFLGFQIWLFRAVQQLIHGLPKSSERLTIAESFSNSAKVLPLSLMVALEIFSLGALGLGIYLYHSYANSIIAGAIIIVFGTCTIATAYWILKKIQITCQSPKKN